MSLVENSGSPTGDDTSPASPLVTAITPGPTVPAPHEPQFSSVATVFWTVLLMVGLGFVFWSVAQNRALLVPSPERYLDRILGRDLDCASTINQLAVWQRWINHWNVSEPSDALSESVRIYREFIDRGALPASDRVHEKLAIMLAEAGKLREAEMQLEQLNPSGETAEFQASFQVAYRGKPMEFVAALRSRNLTPEWVVDRMEARQAAAHSDPKRLEAVSDRLLDRARRWHRRISALSVVNLLLLAAGSLTLLWSFRRPVVLGPVSTGNAISSWTARHGYAVVVRGAVAGLVVAGGLSILSDYSFWISGVATLLSAVPLFWFAQTSLARSGDGNLLSAFGLSVRQTGLGRLAPWALACLALVVVGEFAIGVILHSTGSQELVESVPPELLFDSWLEVFVSMVDAVVWAPLIEEVLFRGIIYTTFRRHLNPFFAACACSVIFAAAHGYSIQGFLVIFWSGLVWCWAYERARSLWPSIVCHAIGNLLAVGSPVLLYRL